MSTKKRKTSTPEREDLQVSPMAFGEGSTRKVRKATRQSVGQVSVKNRDFVRLKDRLCKAATQEIMESDGFRQLFQPGGPRLPSASQGAHPEFVNETVTDLRWQLQDVHNLYRRPTGDVIAMGQEDTGQLGLVSLIGVDKDDGFPPTLVHTLYTKGVQQVAAGGMHSVAVTQDGEAYTWGCSDNGQLGRTYKVQEDEEDEKYATPPTKVINLFPSKHAVSKHSVRSPQNECDDIIAVDAGAGHTLFMTISGNVYLAGK